MLHSSLTAHGEYSNEHISGSQWKSGYMPMAFGFFEPTWIGQGVKPRNDMID